MQNSIYTAINAAVNEIQKVIIGKQDVIRKVMMSILANGHILLDDVPGVGKTTLAVALGKTLGLKYNRIQQRRDWDGGEVTKIRQQVIPCLPGIEFRRLREFLFH